MEPTIARAVNAALPEIVDPWRMVQARRSFAGRLPLSALSRLASSLATLEGEVDYQLDFDKDEFGVAGVHVQATSSLPLICQRTLEPFVFPVSIDTRLGFIVREEDEAGLPPGYEPLLLDGAGLHPAAVIEDELILALPLVPVKPGTGEIESEQDDAAVVETRVSPFAVLKEQMSKQ